MAGRKRKPTPVEGRRYIKKRHPEAFDGTDDLLTVRERLFVLHYNANGFNASQAARDAGFSCGKPHGIYQDGARVIASKVKSRPLVKAALDAVMAKTTRELGDVALAIRIRMLEVMLSDDRDRVPAGHLLAECTPGALVPKEVKVDAKMTYADMVLAAQRKREGETVVTGDVATNPVLPDAGPAPEPAE